MVSYGDEVDVLDWGVCKLNENGSHTIFLVEESDDSINWLVNPDEHSGELILLVRKAEFVRKR